MNVYLAVALWGGWGLLMGQSPSAAPAPKLQVLIERPGAVASSPPVTAATLPPGPVHPAELQAVPRRVVPTPLPSPFVSPDRLLEPGRVLAWDAEAKEAVLQEGEVTAHFTFYLTNISSSEVLINSVATSCGCTAAELPTQPWRIAPGGSGPIQVTMNMAGKFGRITKDVTVNTSVGRKMLKVTSVGLDAPAAPPVASGDLTRMANMQAALGDRQSVFRNDCARCHVQPGVGKQGEELYVASCGICHDTPNRASTVPDLRELPFHTDADFWRQWIILGRPNSMMPAFAKEHGGPLDHAQIDSVVEHLLKAIPSRAPSIE